MLVEKCQQCHGEEKQKGGVRLHSREAVLKGGENGAILTPGDAEKSSLIAALRWRNRVP